MDAASMLPIPRLRVPETARRRRRRNKRRLRLPVASLKSVLLSSRWISLLLLILCGSALAVIGLDENFYLTMIPVKGVSSIPPSEIVRSSGLAGSHIFGAEPAKAARQIAEMPGVISATVELEWPNQAIISIKEDSPVAVWQQGGQQYWVTESGQLAPARVDLPALLHIVVEEGGAVAATPEEPVADAGTDEVTEETADPTEEEQSPDDLLFVPDEVLVGALELRQERPNIESLFYDPVGGLSYQDGRGWRAYFGVGTDMEQKLVLYETIVDKLLEQGKTPAYVSVSNQERPYYLAP